MLLFQTRCDERAWTGMSTSQLPVWPCVQARDRAIGETTVAPGHELCRACDKYQGCDVVSGGAV